MTSCEILVANTKLLVALETRKAQFRTLKLAKSRQYYVGLSHIIHYCFIIQHIDKLQNTVLRENIVNKVFNFFLKKLSCIAYVYRWIYIMWTYVHVHQGSFYHIVGVG